MRAGLGWVGGGRRRRGRRAGWAGLGWAGLAGCWLLAAGWAGLGWAGASLGGEKH